MRTFLDRLNITKTTLLLDKSKAFANIEFMAKKAQRCGVRLRPHFKTHQSAQIGEWFRQHEIDAITVSSVEMAQYFARHGWRDITIAIPVNLREIDAINQLAQKVTPGGGITAQYRLSDNTYQSISTHLVQNRYWLPPCRDRLW